MNIPQGTCDVRAFVGGATEKRGEVTEVAHSSGQVKIGGKWYTLRRVEESARAMLERLAESKPVAIEHPIERHVELRRGR